MILPRFLRRRRGGCGAPKVALAIAAVVAVAGFSPSAASAQEEIHLQAVHSEKCAHVEGGSFANDAPITQWDCIDQTNVIWTTEEAPNGDTFLRARHSDKCAHLQGGSFDNGTPITQWECIDQTNVTWRLERAGRGTFFIRNTATDKCMHVDGGSFDNGALITQWDCIDQTNVKWRMIPVNE